MDNRFNSVFRSDLFAGKTILVTGGGTGIGRCIGHELAALGAEVILSGRRTEPLEQTAEEIREAGGVAHPCAMNIREQDEVNETVGQLVRDHGPIHGLVNNAGGQFLSPAAMIKAKGWRAVIDTNLNGTFFVSQAIFQSSMASHGGTIVNIVADMWNGFPGMAHTGAARAGVVNLTKTLSIEWASAGVRVNAVAPGVILSSGMNNYPASVQKMLKDNLWKNPSSRLGTESEVSASVVFLLSPASAYISGTTIRVDGASSLQKEPMFPYIRHDRMTPWDGFHLKADLPEMLRPDSDS
ncbi:MAG: 2,4-dienoyl-CoA reductase [Myxococcales bacterium]|nr:2,4-dienoyl-CoA reductase [Myxococcales bacterium]